MTQVKALKWKKRDKPGKGCRACWEVHVKMVTSKQRLEWSEGGTCGKGNQAKEAASAKALLPLHSGLGVFSGDLRAGAGAAGTVRGDRKPLEAFGFNSDGGATAEGF